MKKQKGFSLIELLIVVAIILIIAAIAIPNLLRARISANESSAASAIRSLNTAEVSYTTSYNTFTQTMANLGPGSTGQCPTTGPTSTSACLIDSSLAAATATTAPKSGYVFKIGAGATGNTTAPLLDYTAGTAPAAFNTSGVNAFCSTEDGVVRKTKAPASSIDATSASTNSNCVGSNYSPLGT